MKIESEDWVFIVAIAAFALIVACAGMPDIIAAFRGAR